MNELLTKTLKEVIDKNLDQSLSVFTRHGKVFRGIKTFLIMRLEIVGWWGADFMI